MGSDGVDLSAAMAGLAREVEALSRRTDKLAGLGPRVEQLAELLSRLAAATATNGSSPAGNAEPVPTWLAGVHTTVEARVLLVALDEWVRGVFLRYGDAEHFPRECWPWHPDVVEELLWLQAMWMLAYDTQGAKPSATADWHDRYRPGVVKRICGTKGRGGYAGGCTIENHQGVRRQDTPPVNSLDGGTLDSLTEWWSTSRDTPAPDAPTSDRQRTP